jgi:hypothetical protein
MLRDQELELLHRNVLRYTSGDVPVLQPAAAAVLACGKPSVASHRSAAAVWGLDVTTAEPEVTVPYRRNPKPPGVIVYRNKLLRPSDTIVRRGIPVTSPARTLLDLAGVLDDELAVELPLDQAIRERLAPVGALTALLQRPELEHARGAGVLRDLMESRHEGRWIGGFLATRFYSILRRAGLPLPVAEYKVMTPRGPRYIDFAYPDQMLALEVDDYASHMSRVRFDGDRARRWELLELEWRVAEVTSTMMRDDERELVQRVANALGLEPARWRHIKRPPSTRSGSPGGVRPGSRGRERPRR